MAAIYSTDFTAADGTTLAALDANWVVAASTTNVTITSNAAVRPGADARNLYQVALNDNCYMEGVVAANTAAFSRAHFVLRAAVAETTSYGIRVRFRESGETVIYDGFSGSVWSDATAWPAGTVARVELEGTTLRIYKNGSLLRTHSGISVTNASNKYNGLEFLTTNSAWTSLEIGNLVNPIPADPSNVTVGTITNAGATVSWTDNSSNETGFAVEYAVSPYSSWTAAAQSPAAANAVSLAITGLSGGTTYKTRVRATAAGGNSAYVESAEFTTRQRGSPTSTVSAGAWTASGAATLHEAVDEVVASDADYGFTQASSAMKLGFNVLSAPEAGTRSISYEIWSPSGSNMAVVLMEGDTIIQSWTHPQAPVQKTIFTQTITNAVTNWANLRVRVEGN